MTRMRALTMANALADFNVQIKLQLDASERSGCWQRLRRVRLLPK